MSSVIDPRNKPSSAADFVKLRAEGYQAIERMSSDRWTDYNAHDPGITLLEHLADALSEIGYRGEFDIADLLTGPGGGIDYRQPFFTARSIFSNAALTNDDYRRLMIDSLSLSNAWIICKKCSCGPNPYPECSDGDLAFAPRWRSIEGREQDEHEDAISIRGFSDVLVQFAPNDELGNLNSNRVDAQLLISGAAGQLHPVSVELRLPEWRELSHAAFELVGSEEAELTTWQISRFSRDRILAEPVDEDDLRRGLRDIFFLDIDLEFTIGLQTVSLSLPESSLRIWSNGSLPSGTDGAGIAALLEATDLIQNYHRVLQFRARALEATKLLLHSERRLGEDYCRCDRILAEDVAVCADLHLHPEADVELTLAKFYRTLEKLLNPGVPFRTLAEMEALGLTSEEIFSGPALQQGFIQQEDLDASRLRSEIYVSDLINELMDIEGVAAIEALRFTVYDAEGRPVLPAHEWCIPVSAGHYPNLYIAASQVLPYKDGLPLLPRQAELRSTLNQLRAEDRAFALPVRELDYPIPTGRHRGDPEYLPVQRTLPATYGLSHEGLPDSAPDSRKAKAQQLAAYMIPMETIGASTAEQLNHFGDLFSTDENIVDTYRHPNLFDSGGPLEHLSNLLDDSTQIGDHLASYTEGVDEFEDRRNRFLDHVLARFGEQIQNYPLLIHDQSTRRAYGATKLIQDKIRFLRFLPEISARRGIGINYRLEDDVCAYRNRSGLGERIRRLLGMEDLRAYFELETIRIEEGWQSTYSLTDPDDDSSLISLGPAFELLSFDSAQEAEEAAWKNIELLIERASDLGNYRSLAPDVFVTDGNGLDLAQLADGLVESDLHDFITERLQQERLYLVEHILLRPKFYGDALMDVCLGDDCQHHGLEDPYSFRLTYLLPADVAPYSEDMDLRRYADRLIRRETPVHLLPKICWISDVRGEDEYTEEELEDLIEACICPPPSELARQLSRFEAVWCPWLEANAQFDWTAVLDELEARIQEGLALENLEEVRLLLGYFGERFRQRVEEMVQNDEDITLAESTWMDEVWPLFEADLDIIALQDSSLSASWDLTDPARLASLRDILEASYTQWLDVSASLHRLLDVFQSLRSAYPQATLHDCDDGDDENPVRLDQTTLGTQ